MKKILLTILIAALLVGAAIYDMKVAIALAAIVIFIFAFKVVMWFLMTHIDKWEARARAKRIKKIREREQERRANIERIIREVPQEHFAK